MRLSVIIPTLGRQDVLRQALAHLAQQTRLPDQVIVSATCADDVGDLDLPALKILTLFGSKGSCVQRNRALIAALPSSDIITFLDDDFLLGPDYLQDVEAAFNAHPDWSVIGGFVVADGAHGKGLTFAEGARILADYRDLAPSEATVIVHPGAYGCNMSLRACNVGDLRFDERLALYGWQEDIDFTAQLKRFGKIVSTDAIYGVHLGVKSGRVSGMRFGYSQMCNPIYLLRKGTIPAGFALKLLGKNLAANIVRSIRPEPWIDRRGRLKGNLLAIRHLMAGRIEPEHILQL
jgi:GT2 family glycosyltransferase